MASVNLDIAQRLDITCRKGDTFSLTLNMTDSAGTAFSLTPYTFRMEVRDQSDDSIIIANSTDYFDEDADSTTGKLVITIANTVMDTLTPGSYVYDLQTVKSGVTETWLYGIFKVNDDITAAS